MIEIKNKLYQQINRILDQKITDAQASIESTRESMNNETKSSAGDKHETGRAMMQIEMAQNEAQLSKAILLKNDFFKINPDKEFSKVESGSLVLTNQENYFISIGIGKIEMDGEKYYAISLDSPIGKILKDKVKGDVFQFQGREFLVKEIG